MTVFGRIYDWMTPYNPRLWTKEVIEPPAQVDYTRVLSGPPNRAATMVGGVMAALLGFMLVLPLLMQACFAISYLVRGKPGGNYLNYANDALAFKYFEGMALSNLALAIFIPMALLLVRYLHQRPMAFASSVQPGLRWRYLLLCSTAAIVTVNLVLWTSRGFQPMEGAPQPRVVAWLVMILITSPLQAAGEEYLFRGYLTQVLGSFLSNRWLAVLVASLGFAFVHGVQNLPLFLNRFAFGLLAGALVVVTGGLEATIAAHAVNNVFAFGYAARFGGVAAARGLTEVTWTTTAWNLAAYVLTGLACWAIGRALKVAVRTPQGIERVPNKPTRNPV